MSPSGDRSRTVAASSLGLVLALLMVLVGALVVDGLPRTMIGTGQSTITAEQTLPPWPSPADPSADERAAGLTVLPGEGVRLHIHAHLDISVDGRPVTVPAHLGIDVARGLYAELHTHTDSGVLHVESQDPTAHFVLGQLFTEWGVRLSADQIGALRSGDGRRLFVYVDGKRRSGDPARIALVDHREILLAFGDAPPASVPAEFDFVKTPT